MSWEKWTSVILHREKVETPKLYAPYFYLDAKVHTWLLDHAGKKARFFTDGPTGSWHHDIPMGAQTISFYFRDPKVAMLFKLTFG